MAVAVLASSLSFADETVHEYQRQDGTVVREHERTEANGTRDDNYSTKGNTNPYTGEEGTKPRDSEYSAPRTSHHKK